MNITETTKKLAVPGMIVSLGGYQVYKDYKNADSSDKKNILLKDIFILTGTCAGAYAGHRAAQKILSSSNRIKSSNNIIEEKPRKISRMFLDHIPKNDDFVENLSVPLGGIIGGILSGQIIEKYLPVKPAKVSNELNHKLSLLNDFDYGTMGKAYNYAGISLGAPIDNIFSTLSGFTVGKEYGIKNKVKKATYEIIAGVIIPVCTTVFAGRFVNALKPDIKPLYKSIILMPIIISSYKIGRAIADWFNNRITEKLIEKQLWTEISRREKALIQISFKFIHSKNTQAKNDLLEDMEQLRQIKKQIKNDEK